MKSLTETSIHTTKALQDLAVEIKQRHLSMLSYTEQETPNWAALQEDLENLEDNLNYNFWTLSQNLNTYKIELKNRVLQGKSGD